MDRPLNSEYEHNPSSYSSHWTPITPTVIVLKVEPMQFHLDGCSLEATEI
jgi:hypothetical protein